MTEEVKLPEWAVLLTTHARKTAVKEELSVVAFINSSKGLMAIPISSIPEKRGIFAKEVFSSLVRRVAIESNSSDLLVISESYVKILEDPTEEQVAAAKNLRGLKGKPGVKEALFFMYESLKGSWAGAASIEGKLPNRTIGTVEFHPFKGEGRMSNFLPDKDASASMESE